MSARFGFEPAGFPIHDNAPKTDPARQMRSRLGDLPDDVIRTFLRWQPWALRPDNPPASTLSKISKFDNDTKHKLGPPTIGAPTVTRRVSVDDNASVPDMHPHVYPDDPPSDWNRAVLPSIQPVQDISALGPARYATSEDPREVIAVVPVRASGPEPKLRIGQGVMKPLFGRRENWIDMDRLTFMTADTQAAVASVCAHLT